jgi:hypothetical protein
MIFGVFQAIFISFQWAEDVCADAGGSANTETAELGGSATSGTSGGKLVETSYPSGRCSGPAVPRLDGSGHDRVLNHNV